MRAGTPKLGQGKPRAARTRPTRLHAALGGAGAALTALALVKAVAPHARNALARRFPALGLKVLPVAEDEEADLHPQAFEAREPGRGRTANRPWQIPFTGWIDILWRVFKGFNGDRLPFVAGGVTFFTLLAVFPAIGVFLSLYGLFADTATAQKDLVLLEGVLPGGVLAFVGDQIQWVAGQKHETLGLAFSGSLLLSLWSANASIKTLIYGLNIAYHETEKRNFLRYSALTLTFTLGGLAFVLFSSALVVAAPIAAGWFGWAWNGVALGVLRWPVLFFGYFAMTSVLYRFGPSRQRARWSWLSLGAVVAAALSLGVSWVFSTYLGGAAHYDRTYGPMGAIMGFMVWTWWSITVILIGAELNAEMERQTAQDTTTGRPQPLGERGALVADTVGPRRGKAGARKFTLDGAMALSRKTLKKVGKRPDRPPE
jgi:membrane protein